MLRLTANKKHPCSIGGCSPEEVLQLMSGAPTSSEAMDEEKKNEALSQLRSIEQIGDSFPFVGRECSLKTVKGIVADLFRRFRDRKADALDVMKRARVLICYAAYGAGKSRFGKEVPVAVRKLLEDASDGTALDSELLTALNHPFHTSLGVDGVHFWSPEQVVKYILRRLLSLVFSKGQRYAAFQHRFSTIDEFTRECEAHEGWSAESVAMLLQPDKGSRVCFVHMDEAQELSEDQMQAVTRCLTAVWRTDHRTLFVPLFTGTNPTRLTNTSGAREEVVRLEPLSANALWRIMRAVCRLDDDMLFGRYLRLFLDSIRYCPRLLQVSRFAMLCEIAVCAEGVLAVAGTARYVQFPQPQHRRGFPHVTMLSGESTAISCGQR